MGPCILLMLPRLNQDLEQRPVSLQATDDGWKIGPEVMPVSSVTLSGRHGRRARADPFCAGSGSSALARQGTQVALIRVACTGPRAGLVLPVAFSGKGQCYRQGLVHATHGGR
jgi:hypothetical protein